MAYRIAGLDEFASASRERFATALRYSWLRPPRQRPPADSLPRQPTLSASAFGANPGDLHMLVYAPLHRTAKAPLVVVLHGCKQTAQAYAQGAGWLTLADRCGFVVLCPEQKSANNRNGCFNWFQPSDTRRGEGEVESIRQMIGQAIVDYDLDPDRVFVTGLSAGGAMACALLAVYPEIFAGGAIVAGLPYGSAANVSEALGAMSEGQSRSASELGAMVRSASPYNGPWPTISVWQGDADKTVNPSNAEQIILQWTNIHQLPETPDRVENIDGYTRRVWLSSAGQTPIESYTVRGLGHGTPLAAGVDGYGTAGPFLIEKGLSSSALLATGWGLERKSEQFVETVENPFDMRHADTQPAMGQPTRLADRSARDSKKARAKRQSVIGGAIARIKKALDVS